MPHRDSHWAVQVLVWTRLWLHYGTLAFTFATVAIAGISGLLQP